MSMRKLLTTLAPVLLITLTVFLGGARAHLQRRSNLRRLIRLPVVLALALTFCGAAAATAIAAPSISITPPHTIQVGQHANISLTANIAEADAINDCGYTNGDVNSNCGGDLYLELPGYPCSPTDPNNANAYTLQVLFDAYGGGSDGTWNPTLGTDTAAFPTPDLTTAGTYAICAYVVVPYDSYGVDTYGASVGSLTVTPLPACVVPAASLGRKRRTLAQMERALHSADCETGRITRVRDRSVPLGEVVRLNASKGRKLKHDAKIGITVSLGK